MGDCKRVAKDIKIIDEKINQKQVELEELHEMRENLIEDLTKDA